MSNEKERDWAEARRLLAGHDINGALGVVVALLQEIDGLLAKANEKHIPVNVSYKAGEPIGE